MNIYRDFAYIYDELMDDVPYDMWADYIISVFREYGINDGLVAELGCGTGAVTARLQAAGYDMIGIDASDDMLNIAVQSAQAASCGILYLCQDMREFELYGTVRAIVCVCDSINYLTDSEDIVRTFELVNNYLDPGGIFICDFNTAARYRSIGDSTIAENRDDCSFIWENAYDDTTHINEYGLTLYIASGSDATGEIYRRSTETHRQRGYTLKEMENIVNRSGLRLLRMVDADTHEPADEDCERIYIIATENGKNV